MSAELRSHIFTQTGEPVRNHAVKYRWLHILCYSWFISTPFSCSCDGQRRITSRANFRYVTGQSGAALLT